MTGQSDESEALDNIRRAIEEYLAAVDDQIHGEQVRVVEVTTIDDTLEFIATRDRRTALMEAIRTGACFPV